MPSAAFGAGTGVAEEGEGVYAFMAITPGDGQLSRIAVGCNTNRSDFVHDLPFAVESKHRHSAL
jgi:hypothetical protein